MFFLQGVFQHDGKNMKLNDQFPTYTCQNISSKLKQKDLCQKKSFEVVWSVGIFT